MAILSTVIRVAAIIWVIAQLLTTRKRARQGEIVVPPLFAATLVFILFILVAWIMGASPLHLLWLFPLSFVLGIAVLLFPGVNCGSWHVTGCWPDLRVAMNPSHSTKPLADSFR